MTKFVQGKGAQDVIKGIQNIWLPLFLAKSEIRQRYRRSTLGPFWITVSTGIMIATIGIIFGKIFNSPISEFLPYLAAGLILWGYISSTINESTGVFTTSEVAIKQLPLPLFIYVQKLVARNFYIFLHNILIFPIVCLFVHRSIGINVAFVIPGILLIIINLLWISLLLGIICARYRDLTQIVASVVQILFYVTPIIWMPGQINSRVTRLFVDINPFYHLLSVVRKPLLNEVPSIMNWSVSLGLCCLGWIFTLVLFNVYKKRIAYWL